MRTLRRLIVVLPLLAAAGCGGPKAYVRPGFMDHPPRRVAVLPFVITFDYDQPAGTPIPAAHQGARDLLRKTFYYGLTPLGYQDMNIADVDAQLAQRFGPLEQGGWASAAAPEVAAALGGVDALVYGDITRLVHLSTPLFTETSVDVSLRMVDAASGEVLWRRRVKSVERGGALVSKGQVVDFVKDQVRSFRPNAKFMRVAEALTRTALQDFPNPPIADAPAAPSAPGRLPKLAILPFDAAHESWLDNGEQLRSYLTASLQDSVFEIIELQAVDAALKAQGWQEGQALPESLSLEQVQKTLGADVVLRGTVTNWGRTYMVVQSWVKAALELELVDPSSGDTIWSGRRHNTRQSGILKGPTGYKAIATAPLSGMKGGHLDRIAYHLAKAMAQDVITAPSVMAYLDEHSHGDTAAP